MLENSMSRKIYGFDAFGEFPNDLKLDSDKKFVDRFEKQVALGLAKKSWNSILIEKVL